ncbi:MAG: hypothetical protein KAT09_05605, partial [Candidatus Aegiribacteria sp.]|nr:hypothetical protein [Candidatus Aegiribacteria sp.]
VLKSVLYRIRPYELENGSTDRMMEKYLAATAEVMSSGNSLIPVLEEAASDFMSIPRMDVPKPLVLMFGEIYVRNDSFAHSYTDLRIEALGGEVLYTPLMEWFEYVNYSFISRSKSRRKLLDLIKGYSRTKIMKRLRRKLEVPFADILADRPGLEPEEIMKAAQPYMKENIGGEAILCVGAPLAFNEKAAIDGAINIFPFTCLPGTVVTAISKKIRKEHRNLPWLNLAFDGQEDTDNEARLQAFMYQVRQNFRVRSAKMSDNPAAAIEIEQ